MSGYTLRSSRMSLASRSRAVVTFVVFRDTVGPVAARVGKAVRVVDPEAVDGAVPEERHEQRMGRREDDRVLDASKRRSG